MTKKWCLHLEVEGGHQNGGKIGRFGSTGIERERERERERVRNRCRKLIFGAQEKARFIQRALVEMKNITSN